MIKFLSFLVFLMSLTSTCSASSLAPSLEAQSVATKVIHNKINNSAALLKMVDLYGSKIEWLKSSVDGLFYGVFWATYTFPNGQVSRNPSRFYVQDRGVNSLIIIGTFVNSAGYSLDQNTIHTKILSVAKKGIKSGSFPKNPLTVVKKGKDRIVVFTDPDCPYCKKTIPELIYLSKMENIQLELLYTPIDSIHPNAREKSLVILSLNPKDRLAAEVALENVESGNRDVLVAALEVQGLYPEKTYQDKAESLLMYGEDLAARYGIRGTPNILVPSTMKAIQGVATASEILEKLK